LAIGVLDRYNSIDYQQSGGSILNSISACNKKNVEQEIIDDKLTNRLTCPGKLCGFT
jgi:hypothetical protein